MEINSKKYDEITDRVAKLVANLKILDLNGHVIVDTSGRIPTACWSKNAKTGDFIIRLGYGLLIKLDDEETLGIIEHELLHHVHYRDCDIRDHLMSNIVLDVAINKILYLCNPSVTERWAHKVYDERLEEHFASPVILACPHLDAEQIKQISDPRLQKIYIEIWGSRETSNDFNLDVPVPLSLYYKLVQFIDEDEPQDGSFGEESENESDGESDSESDDGQQSKNKKNQKGKKSKQRCKEEAPDNDDSEDEPEAGSDDEDSEDESEAGGDDEDSEDESEAGGDDEDSEDESEAGGDDEDSEDESEAGGDDEDSEDESEADIEGRNEINKENEDGYGEIEKDPLDTFSQGKEEKAKEAGQGQTKISFAFAPPPEIDSAQIEQRLKERIFEQTVDEIGDIVAGSLQNNIARQPYVIRPTRTTLTHMACGVTDYLPFYYNETPGQGRPKVGCYVDVSGSMEDYMLLVHSIMCRIGEFMPSMSFVFSNYVLPLPTLAWNGIIPLGGGTSFRNVFKHICLSREVKQQWLEEWIKKNPVGKARLYRQDSELKKQIAEYIEQVGIQGDFISEDFPVIFLITDGEDDISSSLIEDFKESGKQLIVLLLTEHVLERHAFTDLDATIIQINSDAKIISRGSD